MKRLHILYICLKLFMNLIRYFFSKYFFKQIFYASIISGIIIASIFLFLNISTNHNNYINVPDLKGLVIDDAKKILNEKKLKFEISDSTFFNPNYPKYSVLEQIPFANSEVKKNRKIYLTINPVNYGNVAIPNIIQITKRSAISALLSSNLELGEINLVDNIGKDMVIKILYNEKEINPGFLVPKKSKIDLVLGNGVKVEK